MEEEWGTNSRLASTAWSGSCLGRQCLVRALKYHSFTHSRYTQPKTSAPPGCRAGQRKKRDSEEFDRKKSVEDFCQLGYKKGFSFLFEQCFGH